MSQHPGSAPAPETQGTQRPVRGVLGERRLIQGTLTPRNTPYFRQNGASCSRARSAVDPGGSAENQFREKITAATQKVMWQKGFYPGDTEYDMIAMSVLSKPNLAAAKADYPLYADLIKKISKAHKETAARNYRTEVSKKISEMSEELWSGQDGCPWDVLGKHIPEVANEFLLDNQYRTGGHDDYFGLEDYRKIVYASKPDPKEEEFDLDPHNNITHLSAHQLAFVEIKVRSLLKGEKSLPKYDRRRAGAIKEYEEIVREMRTV